MQTNQPTYSSALHCSSKLVAVINDNEIRSYFNAVIRVEGGMKSDLKKLEQIGPFPSLLLALMVTSEDIYQLQKTLDNEINAFISLLWSWVWTD